jgi:hypothetical protein
MAVLTSANVTLLNTKGTNLGNRTGISLGSRISLLNTDGTLVLSAAVAHALTTPILTLGANANATGSAFPLAVALTAAMRLYGEDNGAVYTPSGAVGDIRTGIFRHLLTTDHSAVNIRAFGLQGILAGYNATWDQEVVAGVEGIAQIVTTGAKSYEGYGLTTGLVGRLATAGTLTISANHVFAGVTALADIKGTVTQTGRTVAFLAKKYDTTNWSDATSRVSWGIGLYMPRTSVVQAVRIGDWAGSGAPGSAIVLSAATDSADTSQRNLVACYGESVADLTSAIHANVGRFRHLVSGAITANHETYGLAGQLVGKACTLGHLHAGLLGTFEANTSDVTINGTYSYGAAGVMARVGGLANIAATKAVSGFTAFLNGSAALKSGTSVAFAADCLAPTTASWDYLLAANGAANFFYAATGTAYENSVKIGSMSALGGVTHACSGLVRVKVNTTLYYIPLYAASDLTGE